MLRIRNLVIGILTDQFVPDWGHVCLWRQLLISTATNDQYGCVHAFERFRRDRLADAHGLHVGDPLLDVRLLGEHVPRAGEEVCDRRYIRIMLRNQYMYTYIFRSRSRSRFICISYSEYLFI